MLDGRCWARIIDTHAVTVTLPPHTRSELRERIATWPPSRVSASAKRVSTLVGFLMRVSFAVRQGSFFVERMLVPVGVPRITAGADVVCHTTNPGRSVALGPEVHRGLYCWRWFVVEGILSARMYHTCLSARPGVLCLRMLPKTAIRGICIYVLALRARPRQTVSFLRGERGRRRRTMFLSTPMHCWGWWFRRGSLFHRARSAGRRRETTFCSAGEKGNEAAVEGV